MRRVRELERKIYTSVGENDLLQLYSATRADSDTTVTGIYRIAALIYLNRAIYKTSSFELRRRRLAEKGLRLLAQIGSFDSAWPLFILGCEADSDEQRLGILEVFRKTAENSTDVWIRINYVQHLVEAFWNQTDLNAEHEVDYVTTTTAITSGLPFLPPFI